MERYQPIDTIIQDLAQALHQQSSGTFFIATTDNQSARFLIQQGQIQACCFGRLGGDQAIAEILHIEAARGSFSEACCFSPRAGEQVTQTAVMELVGEALEAVGIDCLKPAPKVIEPASNQSLYQVYRGQWIEHQPRSKRGAVAKKKMIYRGQVIS